MAELVPADRPLHHPAGGLAGAESVDVNVMGEAAGDPVLGVPQGLAFEAEGEAALEAAQLGYGNGQRLSLFLFTCQAAGPRRCGAAAGVTEGIRTPDLLDHNQAL